MIGRILFVSDGIIAVITNGDEFPGDLLGDADLVVTEYGAELRIAGIVLYLPVAVLDHLEQAEGTNVHFYESDTYSLVAPYRGSIVLSRDEILKVKGAWEYSQATDK